MSWDGTCWSGSLGDGLYPPMIISRIYLDQMTGDLRLSTLSSYYILHFEQGSLVDCTSGNPAADTPPRQAVSDLFNWDDGWYSFTESPAGQTAETSNCRATAEIILDGVREIENLTLVEQALGHAAGLVSPVETPPDITIFDFSMVEGFLLSRLEGSSSVQDLCLVSPVTRPETLLGLYVLLCTGMVETTALPPPQDGAAIPGPSEERSPEPIAPQLLMPSAPAIEMKSIPEKQTLGVPSNRNWRDEAAAVYGKALPERESSGVLKGSEPEGPEDMARYHFEQGLEHFTREDFHSAVQLFRLAVKIDDQKAEYHRHLALALSRNPLWSRRAEEALRRAVELEPKHAETHYFLGRIYLDSGMPARAVEHFERSLQIDPELEPARLELLVMKDPAPEKKREPVPVSLFDGK